MKLKKFAKWAGRRLKEPSTYVGAGMVAAALGAPELGVKIDHAGQIIMLILGSGLATASTRPTVPYWP